MAKRYYKEEEKSLLEEILNRNRRLLARMSYKQAQKKSSSKFSIDNRNIINYKQKTPTQLKVKKGSRSKLASVFKVIKWAKNYSFLYNSTDYARRKSDCIENNLGEIITAENIAIEVKRWNLLKDEDNLKSTAKVGIGGIDQDDLLHRQVCHSSFSLPSSINSTNDKKIFHQAMRESLAELFPYNIYSFGIHEDTNNMHCHINIKTRNEINNKQLVLDKKDLKKIHTVMNNKCKELGLDLGSEEEKKQLKQKQEQQNKNKQKAIYQPRLPRFYEERVPNWKSMYKSNSFIKITADKNTINKLKELGMSEDKIYSFLQMYKEDKKLALNTVNKRPDLFNIKKQEKWFTLRKVSIFEDKKETSKVER
ncbi:MAG: relaxase/mobilization nuclease domain-containing protein [Alphaproteobacteria bacterium]|jgi:hypothetical protein|nr:relaxase/mobilization nuclease domain-containing protein [Alphaproteobacteria bacterium]